MPFTGKEGAKITRAKAKSMIQGFQKSKHFREVTGGFYGKKVLLDILNQPHCVGIRYYFAHNSKKQPTIVLVGEDDKGKVMSGGLLIEDGPLCPPYCGMTNSLDR